MDQTGIHVEINEKMFSHGSSVLPLMKQACQQLTWKVNGLEGPQKDFQRNQEVNLTMIRI